MEHSSKKHTKLFLGVFAMLALLTLVSFAVANSSLMDHPPTGWTIMMAISVAKALLVVLFFMHLRWETNWKYILTIPAAVMSFVLVFMLVPDIAMRTHAYSRTRQHFAPEVLSQPGESVEHENRSH